jgi:hypothetical protein
VIVIRGAFTIDFLTPTLRINLNVRPTVGVIIF